ncbi:hypothetical protein NKR23_g10115 [Pleurostoma richardsiae]|uniref:EH domain-containing protein n=1 Tax=Pleurostoma richardsiae TaxID=41990 RepID=A0AA38VIK9_9PEZI|nr:hypothetical protein NKR23_g10115 [Pleurostoma richardsiae]
MNPQRTPNNRGHLQPIALNTNANTNHDLSPQAAALRGASLAFQNHSPKPPSSPSPAPSTPRNNGALVAASAASREKSRSRGPAGLQRADSTGSRRAGTQGGISRHTTGGSLQSPQGPDHAAVSQRLSQFLSSPASAAGSSPYLLPPPGGRLGADVKRSPSFIAATLAASRSASRSPSPSPSPLPQSTATSPYGAGNGRQLGAMERRRMSVGANSAGSSGTSLDLPDTSSLAPTTSLISMFEDRKGGDGGPVKKADASPGRRLDMRPKLRPPTPPRDLSPRRDQTDLEPKKAAPKPKPKPKPKPAAEVRESQATPAPQAVIPAVAEVVPPNPRRLEEKPKLRPPTPPPARNTTPLSQLRSQTAAGDITKTSGVTRLPPRSPGPEGQVPPQDLDSTPKQRISSSRLARSVSNSSSDSFVSASSNPSLQPSSPTPEERDLRSRAPSQPPKPKPKTRRPASVRKNTTGSPTRPVVRRNLTGSSTASLPLDSLTSAIMAGSLASARHVPASHTPPPPPPSRHPTRRTGMPQTLRQPPSLSDEEAAARHHHHHHHHPHPKALIIGGKKHAHHEGARHRWRESVTERERRRYEAVWASNRGLFLPDADADYVANVVVRDIWSRSRLPADELAEVWDLVDREGRGVLSKQEFVVGTWLIDQRLRGRKIPTRVTDSVWESVRGVRVRAPVGKGKAKGK